MAVLRIVSLCMLLCCSEAMFKKDMRTVMEEEWPDMKHLGDVVSQATDKAKAIVHQGQEAVEGIKDMALDTFEAAAAKVNQSLKVVGQEVKDMNTTAMKEIISLDEKVKLAKNKAATFAAGTSGVLEQIQPIFEQFLEQLRSVTKMATDALNSISQEKAVMSLDKAMDKVFATASSWKFAMQDLAEKLQQMNESLSGYTPEAHVERPGAAERHKRQAARQGSRADSNLTNSTESEEVAPSLLSMDPVEELSKTLKGPMKELKSAAVKLNDMAEEVTGAMGSFVDGALEAAESKLPKSLMANVTEVLKGVQHEAMQELEPLGEVGRSIVGGLYKAGTDAGLDFDSGVAARLPLTLLMGLAMAFIGFA